MKLSAYTIAKNCTDLNDCKTGIDEVNQYLEYCRRIGKKPNLYAYTRLSKLTDKYIKFMNKKSN